MPRLIPLRPNWQVSSGRCCIYLVDWSANAAARQQTSNQIRLQLMADASGYKKIEAQKHKTGDKS